MFCESERQLVQSQCNRNQLHYWSKPDNGLAVQNDFLI